MDNSPFKIRHGEFHDVEGPARAFNDITFVPAKISLKGSWFQSVFELKDCMSNVSGATKALVHPGDDAAWVLGRLIRLFGTRQIPEADRGEKSCFFASFLAVMPKHDNISVPFECSDHYGRSALTFSTNDPPDSAIQEAIATAFWNLLLADPDDIADYKDTMYHSGAGVWLSFGIEEGEPFMKEIEDPDEN